MTARYPMPADTYEAVMGRNRGICGWPDGCYQPGIHDGRFHNPVDRGVKGLDWSAAFEVCNRCSVKAECEAEGRANHETGVWGGVVLAGGTPSTGRRSAAKCGTASGAARHRCMGDPLCDLCRTAENERRPTTKEQP